MGYHTELHIFKGGSVSAACYRNKILDSTERLYDSTVGPDFLLMDDNAPSQSNHIIDEYLECGAFIEWSGWRIPLTLIPLKIFEIPLAVMSLHVYLFQ